MPRNRRAPSLLAAITLIIGQVSLFVGPGVEALGPVAPDDSDSLRRLRPVSRDSVDQIGEVSRFDPLFCQVGVRARFKPRQPV